MDCLLNRSELEDVFGPQPVGSMLKSIEHFDQHCADMLAVGRAAVLGTTGPDGRARTHLIGGEAGFASVTTPERLVFDLPPEIDAAEGTPAALVVFIPGLGETLRVNGLLRLGPDGGLDAREIYVHCAKAMIRSKLWGGLQAGAAVSSTPGATATAAPAEAPRATSPLADPEVREILAVSPFLVISSHDGAGAADTSPKGDPAGFVQIIDDSTLAVPDRPGNHRTDTWHNVVEQPEIGLLLLVPGDDRILEIRGHGRLTADESVRETMVVNGKAPGVALVVDVSHAEVRVSGVPAAAGLWDVSRNIDRSTLPKMTQVWTDHVKQNTTAGEEADLIRGVLTAEILDEGIGSDYENNLY